MDDQNPRNYLCKFCNFSSLSNEELSLHITTKHKEFKCSICHKKFFNLQEIRAHIKETHLLKWTCQVCDKSFGNEDQYTNHANLHSDVMSEEKSIEAQENSPEPPPEESVSSSHIQKSQEIYKCIFCDFSTSDDNTLDYHIRSHATIDILQCNDCGTCFDSKTELDKHKIVHKKILYQCGICTKKSPSKKVIIRHVNCVHLLLPDIEKSKNSKKKYVKKGWKKKFKVTG